MIIIIKAVINEMYVWWNWKYIWTEMNKLNLTELNRIEPNFCNALQWWVYSSFKKYILQCHIFVIHSFSIISHILIHVLVSVKAVHTLYMNYCNCVSWYTKYLISHLQVSILYENWKKHSIRNTKITIK